MVRNPQVFWYLFGLIPLIAVLTFNYLRTFRIIKKTNRSENGKRIRDFFFLKNFLLSLFIVLAYVFFICSLAGFSWSKDVKTENLKGLDIVFAIDISNSMSSDDIEPSRLQKVSETVKSLVSARSNLRYSVVVFKGDAEIIVPLTENVESVYYVLDFLYPDLLSAPGTNLEAGLLKSFSAFPDNTNTMKMVFLFTDGGESNIDVVKLSEISESKKIKLNIIAVGSPEGGVMYTSDGEIIRDSSKIPIISRPNYSLLETISSGLGGEYFLLSDSLVISKLLKVLKDETLKIGKDTTRVDYVDRFGIFALAAWIMLALYVLVKGVKWKKII